MADFLKTNRLTISFTEQSHFEDILQLRSDPDVQRLIFLNYRYAINMVLDQLVLALGVSLQHTS